MISLLDGPLRLADCNPQLLKLLERQQAAARRPIVLRGCTATANRETITVAPGVVYASGRYIAATEPATFELSVRPPLCRVDTIVLADRDTGPTVELVTGTPKHAPLQAPPPHRGQQALAWVLVRHFNTVFADTVDLDAALLRIRLDDVKAEQDRLRRQQRCRHVRAEVIEDSDFEGPPSYLVVCADCGMTDARLDDEFPKDGFDFAVRRAISRKETRT